MSYYLLASTWRTIRPEKRVIQVYSRNKYFGGKRGLPTGQVRVPDNVPVMKKRKGYIRILSCIPLSVLPGKKAHLRRIISCNNLYPVICRFS